MQVTKRHSTRPLLYRSIFLLAPLSFCLTAFLPNDKCSQRADALAVAFENDDDESNARHCTSASSEILADDYSSLLTHFSCADALALAFATKRYRRTSGRCRPPFCVVHKMAAAAACVKLRQRAFLSLLNAFALLLRPVERRYQQHKRQLKV